MIRFPNFEPDRTRYALDASTLITNAVPVADGWGPLADLVSISAALAAECLGAVYVRTTAGAYRLIAFTASAIYELNTTDYTWTDITGATVPACPTGDRWWFVVFGDNLIAGNLGTVPQFIAITGGTDFADLTGSPPTTRYAWVAGEYLVLAHTTAAPNRIYTSGIGDATYWTVGQRGADFQEFAEGEDIVGGIGAERGAIIFQRKMIRQMVLTSGGDYSFTTSIINPNRGVVAPLSIAQIGPGQFFYYSSDGFMLGAGNLARWLSQVPLDITKHLRLAVPGEMENTGSDHSSFLCRGAPGFRLQSPYDEYRQYTWHTTLDTYDKVALQNVRENAVLVALLAYAASEDPERVGRELRHKVALLADVVLLVGERRLRPAAPLEPDDATPARPATKPARRSGSLLRGRTPA